MEAMTEDSALSAEDEGRLDDFVSQSANPDHE